ncbi:CYTH and CHAD domain-containing protein [Polycladidibacter stylochi]|uniref:CYTH and CHAD domain-containing protein n=1 Tax=Polycladidibacter stylochi TaxID=1807766 RepID=UPI000833AE15|nr:CYTH and CHAD domain-containing protein [Pseudovibrio stylochi]
MQEIELKFSLSSATLDAIYSAPAPEGFQVTKQATQQLCSRYYDSQDHQLRKASMTLRTRDKDGDFLQTIKQGGGVRAGLSNTTEIEHALTENLPDFTLISDIELRSFLEKVDGGDQGPLRPIFETRITRRKWLLTTAGEEITVEVALDQGHACTDTAQTPIVEMELELKKGPPEALYHIAKELLGQHPFMFSTLNKAAIGYQLTQGNAPEQGYPPQTTIGVKLNETDRAYISLQEMLQNCLSQISSNRMAVLSHEDPSGPHQMRVGLRRLRSLLQAGKSYFPEEIRQRFDRDAQLIATALGNLRDLDVLIADIIVPAQPSLPEDLTAAPLLTAIEQAREETRREVRSLLKSTEVNHFLLDLARFCYVLEPVCTRFVSHQETSDHFTHKQLKKLTKSNSKLAAAALRKTWSNVSKKAQELQSLTEEQRHDLRKALKKLRYSLEFFQSLYPKQSTQTFRGQLKKLQDIFGYLNDVAMAERLLALQLSRTSDTAKLSLVIGFIAGWHQARCEQAWCDAQTRWQALDTTPRFWEKSAMPEA